MTCKLSVNINKIALLRNSRGRNYPDVSRFAARCLELGAHGITLHPRQDQRHARYGDVTSLKALCDQYQAELNVEGYPSREFLDVVIAARPAQCTLVPDAPDQLTSDHGWQIARDAAFLAPVIAELKAAGIRTSLFVDADYPDFADAKAVGADRIELYTEAYAHHYGSDAGDATLALFHQATTRARARGLGVNAGHDLNLDNLATFLTIPDILEVSIGHALIVECIEMGVENVLKRYVQMVNGAA